MKIKISLLIFVLITSLLIAACSKANATTTAGSTQTGDPGASALPLVSQLAVGTLKLEDTELAVTPEQAAELLPLWQAYQSLSASDTAATVEIEALVAQIQETMTAEQTQSIEAMQLTNQQMMELMQTLGIGGGGGGFAEAQATPGFRETLEAGGGFPRDGSGGPGGGQGGFPGGGEGGFPGGGGVPPDGGFVPGDGSGAGGFIQGTPDASAMATRQAGFGGRASGVNSMLLNALIQMLETRSQE